MRTVCDRCKEPVKRFKEFKKVGKEYLCKGCYKDNRHNFREETIEKAGIKEEIKELDRKIKREAKRIKYAEERNGKVRSYGENKRPPIPKGSKPEKKKHKSEAYLSFLERQALLKMLMQRGLEFEDAKERVNSLVEEQNRIRQAGKDKRKSEEEIKTMQKKIQERLLEELYNY